MKPDDYAIWVCLECGQQGPPPGRDGVNRCSNGFGAHDTDGQPSLCKIPVRVIDEGTNQHLYRSRRRTEKRLEEWQARRRTQDMAKGVHKLPEAPA